MKQNFEIEFKNMLSKNEYLNISSKVFSNSSDNKYIIKQSNYYFDTKNQDLKNQHSALRVRVTNYYNELTLKTPHEGFLMETNINLSDNSILEILNNIQFIYPHILYLKAFLIL